MRRMDYAGGLIFLIGKHVGDDLWEVFAYAGLELYCNEKYGRHVFVYVSF